MEETFVDRYAVRDGEGIELEDPCSVGVLDRKIFTYHGHSSPFQPEITQRKEKNPIKVGLKNLIEN
jgi:hypothetical protein